MSLPISAVSDRPECGGGAVHVGQPGTGNNGVPPGSPEEQQEGGRFPADQAAGDQPPGRLAPGERIGSWRWNGKNAGGGGEGVLIACMAVVVGPWTLVSLQCDTGTDHVES